MASKFIKEEHKEKPKVSTAALPDIVFMLLFFFMVAASIKSSNYENFITVELPKGKQLSQIENKNYLNYIYVGVPVEDLQGKFGNKANVIVADDRIIKPSEIRSIVEKWRGNVPPGNFKDMQTMLSVDLTAQTGIVEEVEDALGSAQLPKIVYTGVEGDVNANFGR